MSGAKLCGVLRELGYEGAESLDPDSFEWPFQYDDTRPILDWICSSLRPTNVLSSSEILQYEHLLNAGKLLQGDDLNSAYESISAFSTRREGTVRGTLFGAEGLKEIRDGTLTFRTEAVRLENQARDIQRQIDTLSRRAEALHRGKRTRAASFSGLAGRISAEDGIISEKNDEVNAVLGRIASTADELGQQYSKDDESICLGRSSFSEYLQRHSSSVGKLNQWFVKILDTEPSKLVSEEGKVQSNHEDTPIPQHLSELQRLCSVYGISERQWVEGQAEKAKQQAILLSVKSQIASDDAHLHLDVRSLRRRHSELVGELKHLHSRENQLLSKTIPELCQILAQHQDTYVLQGDCDLKVMRQELYIDRQKAFIDHLCLHLAQHKLLKIACAHEREETGRVYSLLKAIEMEVEEYLCVTEHRVRKYRLLDEPASGGSKDQRAVDGPDHLLQGIMDVLSTMEGGGNLGMAGQIGSVREEMAALRSELEGSLPLDRSRCVDGLCNSIEGLQRLLFSSSTTAQPLLTVRSLQDELDSMEKANVQLSAALEQLTAERSKKMGIIKHHPETGIQRRIFVDFFCNPEHLRSQVRELAGRARAFKESSSI